METLRYIGTSGEARHDGRPLNHGDLVEMEDADALAAIDTHLFELAPTPTADEEK